MPAKFRVDCTFIITGSGLAAAGNILEGAVKAGMTVRIPSWPNVLTIAGIGLCCPRDSPPGYKSLLFASRDKDEFTRWLALDLKDRVLKIED